MPRLNLSRAYFTDSGVCGGMPSGVGFPVRLIPRLNSTGSYFTDSGVCGGVPAGVGLRCA